MEDGILKVGYHTYGFNITRIDIYKASEANVIIGKYSSISKDVVSITGGIHPVD